jgi:peroxiredoxin
MYRKYISIAVCLFFSIILFAQPKGFEINGKLAGLKDGDVIVMKMAVDKRPFGLWPHTDSAYVKNGEFHIKGNVPEGPRYYWMELPHDKTCRLFIDNNETITITCDIDLATIPHDFIDAFFSISGSRSNTAFQVFREVFNLYHQSIARLKNPYLEKIKDSIGFSGPVINAIQFAKGQINNAYYDVFWRSDDTYEYYKPSMLFNVLLDWDYPGYEAHAAYFKEIYSGLDEKTKQSYYGKHLKELLPLSVGEPLPAFQLPGPDGKVVSLKDIVKKGKITIVHCWAQNSIIRDQYEKNLRAMYKIYHAKGLNIIGVSTESYADQWKENLQKENYPWDNVLDLKGKIVDSLYHEYGQASKENTTDILVDQQGRIIAWDPVGVTLQWYLWRVLGD